MIFGLVGFRAYLSLHNGDLAYSTIFPVGLREHLLVNITFVVTAIMALFVVLFGLAIFRRKWPIRTWITGTLIGIMLIGAAVGGALAADTVPQVRDRYEASLHTTVRRLPSFKNLEIIGDQVNVHYEKSNKYSVVLRYFGHPNLSDIKTTVVKGELVIDSQNFNGHRDCNGFCIPDLYNVTLTVYSPTPPQELVPPMPRPSINEKPVYWEQ
jgi:hypothetical protein